MKPLKNIHKDDYCVLYDSIEEIRKETMKNNKTIMKYVKSKTHSVFVELSLDCDLCSEEDISKEYLWFELEAIIENKIIVRLIQRPQFISYVVEHEIYEFDFGDITNWAFEKDIN